MSGEEENGDMEIGDGRFALLEVGGCFDNKLEESTLETRKVGAETKTGSLNKAGITKRRSEVWWGLPRAGEKI